MVLIDSYCNEFDNNVFDNSSFEVVRVHLLFHQHVRKVCNVVHMSVFVVRDEQQDLTTMIETNLAKDKSPNRLSVST